MICSRTSRIIYFLFGSCNILFWKLVDLTPAMTLSNSETWQHHAANFSSLQILTANFYYDNYLSWAIRFWRFNFPDRPSGVEEEQQALFYPENIKHFWCLVHQIVLYALQGKNGIYTEKSVVTRLLLWYLSVCYAYSKKRQNIPTMLLQ